MPHSGGLIGIGVTSGLLHYK